MKRSEINRAIRWAEALLKQNCISLPCYAAWTPEEWRAHGGEIDRIRKLMLGWDITDYGCGDFDRIGTVLYTVRNGSEKDPGLGVPYCEKYLIMKDGQRLPKHYHVSKTEDIIDRAGGLLQVFLWNADPATGEQLDTDVTVCMDGIERTVKAGEEIVLSPGNSITLTPYIAHIFGPKPGSGDVICGEVSKVNDLTDNYFLEDTARFPSIEEDEPAVHPMCNEYGKL
ncbi:MAG: D-lyxose/D-mannose family sugar isomerase [Clostridiales bacterium]|nr:D-lyxose/D-mannose family sugar isomerase [Clostridiales bacterium]